MKTLDALKTELLANAETRAAYDEQAAEFQIARELIAARAELCKPTWAARRDTTQSATSARTEDGHGRRRRFDRPR